MANSCPSCYGTGRDQAYYDVDICKECNGKGVINMEIKEGFKIPLLDHGYLMYIEHWGKDERIIESARMSTGKGFQGWGPLDEICSKCNGDGDGSGGSDCKECRGTGKKPGDEKLLRFLYENKHHTPFEVPGITIEVQAPILVFREWHRHRVPFGYNEMSARYTPLPDVNYIPSIERLMIGSDGKNRQAGTVKNSIVLTEENARSFQEGLKLIYHNDEQLYQTALANGVPKELARVHLPVGRYSRMRATGNLRGWLGFLALRMDKNAQFEIRSYANVLGSILLELFPRTMELFYEGKGYTRFDLSEGEISSK